MISKIITSTVIDYTTWYLDLPLFDKIHIEPLYKLLNHLKKQFKKLSNQFPPILEEEKMDTLGWNQISPTMYPGYVNTFFGQYEKKVT